MIKAVGIDIISIERIKSIINRYEDKFLCRIFTHEEIKYCSQKAKSAQHYAGRFAVKEAVKKITAIHISISHENKYALAQAVGEGE